MIDLFKTHSRSLTSPPEFGAAILPDDAADLGHVTRALYVGGGGSLTLRARRRGNVAELQVEDTGSGIPPELHDKVFEEYTEMPWGG